MTVLTVSCLSRSLALIASFALLVDYICNKVQANSGRQIRRKFFGKNWGKKVGEKVGEKTGENVGDSLREIDKLNLCRF